MLLAGCEIRLKRFTTYCHSLSTCISWKIGTQLRMLSAKTIEMSKEDVHEVKVPKGSRLRHVNACLIVRAFGDSARLKTRPRSQRAGN